jgi:metal-sulfur cluster biosynthetic enzyme
MEPEQTSKNKVTWDAEADHPELCEKLRNGLQSVRDPELGLSVIQLGLIRNVIIKDEQVAIKMILTTPYCPYGPAMLEETRSTAEKVLEKPTTIEMGMDPWDFSYMDDEAEPTWGLF